MFTILAAVENITNCFEFVTVTAISESYQVNVYAHPNPTPSQKCLNAYDGPTSFELVFDSSFKVTSDAFNFVFSKVSPQIPYTAELTSSDFATLQTYETALCNFVFLGDKLAEFYVETMQIVVENNTDCWESVSIGYDASGIVMGVSPLQCSIPVENVEFAVLYGSGDAGERSLTLQIPNYNHAQTTEFKLTSAVYGDEYTDFVEYFRDHRSEGARAVLSFESNPSNLQASLKQEISAEVGYVQVLGSDPCNMALNAKIYYNERLLSVQAEFSNFDACYSDQSEKPDLTIEMVFEGESHAALVPYAAIRGTFGVSLEGNYSFTESSKVNAYLEVVVMRQIDEITQKEEVLAEFSAHGSAVRGCVGGIYAIIDNSRVLVDVMPAANEFCSQSVLKQNIMLRVSIVSGEDAGIVFSFLQNNVTLPYAEPFFRLAFTCDDDTATSDCKKAFKRLRTAIRREDERNVVFMDGDNEYCIQRFIDSTPSYDTWIYFSVISVIVLAGIAITVAVMVKLSRI